MSMKAVVTLVDKTLQKFLVDGTVTLTGNYVTDGDTLDLSGLGVPASSLPLSVELWSTVSQGSAMLLDVYAYVPGASNATGKVQIGVAGAEMANTAYATTSPTNATGYVLHFRAEFVAFL